MALPVSTNTNLGSIFENTNLLKDLDTTVATDTFDLVITSELASLNLGGQFTTRAISATPALLEDIIVAKVVWFKSISATESTTDTARHSTVLNGDDLDSVAASTVDKVEITNAIISQDTLNGDVTNFKAGSGVWNSVNTTHTELPNSGDFQVLHISKEEIANESFNITPPIITEE